MRSLTAASSLVWHEVALRGNTSNAFEQQIIGLEPFLAQNWKATISPKTGASVYERPTWRGLLYVGRDLAMYLLLLGLLASFSYHCEAWLDAVILIPPLLLFGSEVFRFRRSAPTC